MKKIETRQYQMLTRVRDFGAAHGHLLPESSLAKEAFVTVGTAVAQLSDHAVSRLALQREGARARKAARSELIAMLQAISRSARDIQASNPEFPNAFRMPERQSAKVLIDSARLFQRNLEPHAPQFIARAMPATFVADFTRALDMFEQLVRAGESAKGETAKGHVANAAALVAGVAAVRQLDVIVGNHLRNNPELVAEWKRDRRIEYPQRRQAPVASSPAATVQPIATSVAA